LADAIRRRSRPPALSEYRRREILDQLADLCDDEEALRKQQQVKFVLCKAAPSGLISIVLHLSLMIALGIYVLTPVHRGAEAISIEVVTVDEEEEVEALVIEELAVDLEAMPEPIIIEPIQENLLTEEEELDDEDDLVPDTVVDMMRSVAEDLPPDFMAIVIDDEIRETLGEVRPVNVGLANRDSRRRQALAYGATVESENSVELALEWLALHQRSNGSWSFNHRTGDHRCQGCRCGNSGSHMSAENGATAMALLPFLGAGRTHLHGEYRREVAGALMYLIDHQKPDGSFMDAAGTMYSHGLATLALCEAYAMARYQFSSDMEDSQSVDDDAREPSDDGAVDPETGLRDINWTGFADENAGVVDENADGGRQLRDPSPVMQIDIQELALAAQQGIRFIEAAQHAGGGWRYRPKQPGDTSIVGWQMMALKSGHLAGLKVQPATIKRAVRFLDSRQSNNGSRYGYTGKSGSEANSAIGLLCRMFTGWDRQREGLAVGVKRMEALARPRQGMYFYYYATQVMHHYGGPSWQLWNQWMRDELVKTQSRNGSPRGSWSFNGPCDSGRLYCTAMAAMTLEVYYRYSPIYGRRAVVNADAGGGAHRIGPGCCPSGSRIRENSGDAARPRNLTTSATNPLLAVQRRQP
jgi:hypothetical protein